MRSTQTSVTTAATLLVAADNVNREVYIHSISNTSIYLGGSTVTTSNGFLLEKDDGYLALTIPINETLYAIVATGTETVSVLLPNE
jgi:hypothetical protein